MIVTLHKAMLGRQEGVVRVPQLGRKKEELGLPIPRCPRMPLFKNVVREAERRQQRSGGAELLRSPLEAT